MDLNRALIYHNGKQVNKISHGQNDVYSWEIGEVVTGPPVNVPFNTVTTNDSNLLKWENHFIPGQTGRAMPMAKSNKVNGVAIGQSFDPYYQSMTLPTNAQHVIGTKTLDSYKKPTVVTTNYTSTEEHPIRRKVSFSDYKWASGTEVVITFRAFGEASGQVRFKMEGLNSVSVANFTSIVDNNDKDTSGRPLHVIIVTMSTASATHYNDYIDLFFAQNTIPYGVNVYLEEGISTRILVNRNSRANPNNLNVGWEFDSPTHASTSITRVGSRIMYRPQPGSWVPYIAVPLDIPVKRGEKWAFLAMFNADYPTTHDVMIELGSTLTWSTSGKMSQSKLSRVTNGGHFVLWTVDYPTGAAAESNYFYISLRGNTSIGSGALIDLDAKMGIVAINLTADGEEGLTVTQLFNNVKEYKPYYEIN